MSWETELREVLRGYLEHEETIAVVIAMYRAIRSGPRLAAGLKDDDTLRDAAAALFEHGFLLQTSAFMGMFSAQMNSAYMGALNAYSDSFEVASHINTDTSEGKADSMVYRAACITSVHNIALTAVMCERGFGYFKPRSAELRVKLMNLRGIL